MKTKETQPQAKARTPLELFRELQTWQAQPSPETFKARRARRKRIQLRLKALSAICGTCMGTGSTNSRRQNRLAIVYRHCPSCQRINLLEEV